MKKLLIFIFLLFATTASSQSITLTLESVKKDIWYEYSFTLTNNFEETIDEIIIDTYYYDKDGTSTKNSVLIFNKIRSGKKGKEYDHGGREAPAEVMVSVYSLVINGVEYLPKKGDTYKLKLKNKCSTVKLTQE